MTFAVGAIVKHFSFKEEYHVIAVLEPDTHGADVVLQNVKVNSTYFVDRSKDYVKVKPKFEPGRKYRRDYRYSGTETGYAEVVDITETAAIGWWHPKGDTTKSVGWTRAHSAREFWKEVK